MTRYQLRILGAPDLRAPDGRRVTSVLSQPSRLSLLAYLTLASGPTTRASIVATFWPENDETRARNALSQAVFYLRRSLGQDAVQSVEGDRLWVSGERVWCDARELLTEDSPSAEVVVAAAGDVLSGWNADGSQPLQEWLDGLRRRVRERAEELSESGAPHEREAPPGADRASFPGRLRPAPDALRAVAAQSGRAVRSPRRPFWIPAGAAAGLVALVLIGILSALPAPDASTTGGPSDGSREAGLPVHPTSTAPARLAVLLPRVTISPGAPELAALTLHDELIARLPDRSGLEVVWAAYASSRQEFTKQLAAIGTSAPGSPIDDMPDWILDVSVIVTGDAVRVVAQLSRGADFGVPGRTSFDQAFGTPNDMVTDVPRALAERVATMVEGVIGG